MIARMTEMLARPRDSDAGDTLGATRFVQYRDSAGVVGGKTSREIRLVNGNVGATVKGAVYMVAYTGVASTSPQAVTCATSTPTRMLVVAREVIAAGAAGWYTLAGWCDALVEGTTDVAVGDFLKLTSGTTATAFIKDGATYSTSSHAVAAAASTANSENMTLIELLGEKGLVA